MQITDPTSIQSVMKLKEKLTFQWTGIATPQFIEHHIKGSKDTDNVLTAAIYNLHPCRNRQETGGMELIVFTDPGEAWIIDSRKKEGTIVPIAYFFVPREDLQTLGILAR